MLDELKEEEIVNKVGGRFKLSALIQKRMVALNTGAKPLVDVRDNDRLSIVVREIMEDRIFLDAGGEMQSRNVTSMANITGTTLGSMGPATVPVGNRQTDND